MIIAENNGDQSGENFAVAFALQHSPAEISSRKTGLQKRVWGRDPEAQVTLPIQFHSLPQAGVRFVRKFRTDGQCLVTQFRIMNQVMKSDLTVGFGFKADKHLFGKPRIQPIAGSSHFGLDLNQLRIRKGVFLPRSGDQRRTNHRICLFWPSPDGEQNKMVTESRCTMDRLRVSCIDPYPDPVGTIILIRQALRPI